MNATLDGREIILGVTGSIAAYKAVYLLRELTRGGARVTVCLSEHAREFVGPLTFHTLSGRPVLTNLFDNSLRYTPAGGRIICSTRRDDGWIALSVRDTGSGIGHEHLGRIFERFYRADTSRSREEGGTGLGLAIVKHLVEAHGGRVYAESERGRGTTVTCWFPDAA